MSFDTLGLSAELVRAVYERGYTKATPIQRKAIPIILEGRDVMAGAQTGTGKTAAFTLPLLQHLSKQPSNKSKPVVRALIITPTRELAAQIQESVRDYGKHLHLRSTTIFGGVNIVNQIQKLHRGVDILVATPGRLLDHVRRKTVDLSKIEILVLDEADRILDMGFIHDLRTIISFLPQQRQNLLFFATFSEDIKNLANSLLKSPALIEVATRNTAAESVAQVIHPVDRTRKRELLSFLIGSNNWKQVLVFTRTKHSASRLAEQLKTDGLTATAIHGDKSQGARTRALEHFKNGTVRVLVATDVASRGLNIDNLPHVINFELPRAAEDYIHRIGRTGRAGKEGEAISLVCVDERSLIKKIEQLLKITIPRKVIPGYEPDPSTKPESIGGNRGQGNSRGRRPPSSRGGSKFHTNSKPKGKFRGKRSDSRSSDSRRSDSRKSNSSEWSPRSRGPRTSDSRGKKRAI